MVRPRRTSSNLGSDISVGDTNVQGLSTYSRRPPSEYSHSSSDSNGKPNSKRRKARSLLRRYKHISLRHTWLNPLLIILAILGLYAAKPGPQNPLHKAIFLSYPLGPDYPGGPTMYGEGRHDLTFVAFYIVVMSFNREFLMQRFIRPLAIYNGIRARGKQSRFMEQFYTAIYFAVMGPFGLYVMYHTEQGALWYFRTNTMFEGFPHRKHEAIFKAYYLLQASYWAQQAIVLMLQLEKPRKDFKELVLHHIVTLSLIGLSYRFHFTRMGIAVYITHDISDFFLATSKTLNYLDSIFVGPYFGAFVAVWIYLRHYINLRILWATLTEFSTVGPYELDWETEQYKCWISQIITFLLLAALQAVNLFWLFFILRILKRYLFRVDLRDDRSDSEEEDEEEDDAHHEKHNGTTKKTKVEAPVLMLNDEPVDMDKAHQMNPGGVRQRMTATSTEVRMLS